MSKSIPGLQFMVITALFLMSVSAQAEPSVADRINLPPGFKLSVYAEGLDNPRSLTLGKNGVVFVGSMKAGKVYALQDINGDGKADRHYIIANNLNVPNGVAYRDGSLYVAEINRILRFDGIDSRLDSVPKPVVVFDKLPNKLHHGWKYLRFGPDGKLYTAVGAPCNICNPKAPVFTSLIRLQPDGSDMEILARGIRNTVGFDWEPDTQVLFFTDNGRDYLGDDEPPEELNKWTKKGQHFGYPFCHGGTIQDPEFGAQKKCRQFVGPEWRFKAHMAPLGIRFYRGKKFPKQYRKQLFVAQHGSWNRSKPQGYRVVLVRLKQGRPVSESVFADGWLTDNDEVLGRPVDILELPDGSLLISDDYAGVIYRIDYQEK